MFYLMAYFRLQLPLDQFFDRPVDTPRSWLRTSKGPGSSRREPVQFGIYNCMDCCMTEYGFGFDKAIVVDQYGLPYGLCGRHGDCTATSIFNKFWSNQSCEIYGSASNLIQLRHPDLGYISRIRISRLDI